MDEKSYCYRYPHPAVTTDCVIFGFDGKRLNLLLIERGAEPYKGTWALPGGFLEMDETVEEGAARELYEETHLKDVYLEQFRVFSAVNRDPRDRVLTVAFYALVRQSDYEVLAGDDAVRANWFDVETLPALAFDHEEIIRVAREHLREKLKVKPIAFRLLNKQFTIEELRCVYESINGCCYNQQNFYKEAIESGLLEDSMTEAMQQSGEVSTKKFCINKSRYKSKEESNFKRNIFGGFI